MSTTRMPAARLWRILSAYPTLLRVGFAGAVAYRAEMVVWMLTTTMPLVSLSLWSAVAAEAPVGGFGARDFAAYFLAVLIIRQITGSWLVWELNQEIRTGALSQRLLKPMHPLITYSAENLGAVPLRLLLVLPIGIVAVTTGRLTTEPKLLLVGAISCVGAWLINFFTMALIGSLAFHVESSVAVFEIWLMTFMVLSGYIVPLRLFPGWLKDLAVVLPFRYTLGFPAEVVITGLLDWRQVWQGLVVQWGYAGVTAAVALLMWRAGVRRFSAFGG